MSNFEKYLKGVKAGIGMGVAFIPFGLTIGLIAKSNGMHTLVTAALSFGIYAGGSEAMLLKMVYGQHSTALEVVISVFMINLRYLLLNLLIFRQLKSGTKFWKKVLVGIGLTDETITYAILKKENSPWYIIGLNTLPYICYGGSSVLGSLFGDLIPEVFRASMSFILYSIYFSLLIMSLQKLPKFFEVIIYVIAMKLAFMYLPGLNMVSSGWAMIIIMISSSLIYAVRHRNEEVGENE
jgi:putative branched-chain amino acid transporter